MPDRGFMVVRGRASNPTGVAVDLTYLAANLQDVSILTGLPVDGDPVTGVDPTLTIPEWQALCLRLLGFEPDAHFFDHSRLRIECLDDRYRHFHIADDAPEEMVQQYVRGQVLRLLGGVLLPDTSSNKMKLMFLPLLEDLDFARRLSWGSAVLACLYRAMCRGSYADQSEIGGYLVLLQIWVWERMPTISPLRRQLLEMPSEQQDPDVPFRLDGPLGYRWNVAFNVHHVSTRVARVYRCQLDTLVDTSRRFLWKPYTDGILAILPQMCTVGHDIWTARVPLICFDVVEWHLPDRVLRQFGQTQGIPEQFDTSQGLHRIDRRGRARIDWRIRHAQYIDIWDARRDHIVHGDPILRGRSYTDDYMAWFFSITVRVIGQSQYAVSGYEGESSTVRLLTDSVSDLVLDTRRALSTTDEDERIQILREMERTDFGALEAIGVDPHTCAPWRENVMPAGRTSRGRALHPDGHGGPLRPDGGPQPPSLPAVGPVSIGCGSRAV
ncbi:serine/threonine-protein phosphatase 7 long form homolog [Elaeis guineensis]|uniref:serine/threonine-protein phosphatase 7 long form homolog n=1 Tax=Elaeis guineensis var. tenera TaxID=51953 RepID=UPI003C6D2D07